MNKIAVLILSSNTYPSVRNSNVQKKLLLKDTKESIFWYKQGNQHQLVSGKPNLINNDLFLTSKDDSMSMGYKTIEAFKWAYENIEFEYIFRTNTSSYFSLENLNNFINENLSDQKFVYSGLVHTTKDIYGKNIEFASGSGYIINKNVVELILENSKLWDHQYWDDVSLAMLLKSLNIDPTEAKRFDITGNPYKQDIDLSNYHFRCRIDNHFGYPRFLEIYVLKHLHKLFCEKKNSKILNKLKSIVFELCKLFYINQFGWKIYLMFRTILKFTLPSKFYEFLKNKLTNKIEKFKLVRFKI